MGLTYTFSNEDSDTELSVLGQNKTIAVIAGSGSRVIPLFKKKPTTTYIIDSSIEQLYLAEMRVEALKQLNRCDFMILLGYKNSPIKQRKEIFYLLKLPRETQQFMENYFNEIEWGCLILSGTWERSFLNLSSIYRAKNPTMSNGLRQCTTLREQIKYFKVSKPKLELIGLFLVFSQIMKRLKTPRKYIVQSLSIYRIFSLRKELTMSLNYAFSSLLISQNFYYRVLLIGSYNSKLAPTLEIDEDSYQICKLGAIQSKISYLHQDVSSFALSNPNKVDFFSLSNCTDYLSNLSANQLMSALHSTLREGGKLVLRCNLVKNYNVGFDKFLKSKKLPTDGTPIYKTFLLEK